MHRNQQKTSTGGAIVLFIVLLNAIILEQGMTKDRGFVCLVIYHDPIVPYFNHWFKAQVSWEFPGQDTYTCIEENRSVA